MIRGAIPTRRNALPGVCCIAVPGSATRSGMRSLQNYYLS
ncbi:hypothetical protein HMPREF0004_2233 [Achromobacter piechaudii ATCC 43553]|uniref:Uncharacterized protein n=1 Tax=Achromobacter piechaudii ATCC 43553 TaxID=742159 RepID=D4X9T6_9BURK|nr:hypothetical protein HMPREF0004_2233 [Achromobacter piechaudii ATCC 43553]